MASGVYTILFIGSILFLARKKAEEEANFLPKIIGYFVLGSLNLTINQVSVPLGFFVYMLFFRPKLNVEVKRWAALLGLLAFILTFWMIPFANHQWESRPKSIESVLGSVYTMDLKGENERIRQELKLEDQNWGLEDFEVDYDQDGRIIDLRWQLAGQNENHFDLYKIRYDTDKSNYQVTYSRADTWLQYDRLVDARRFFEVLDGLDLKAITEAKGDYSSYVIRSEGMREGYAVKDQANFIVSDGKIEELKDEQLPVEAWSISTFGLEKISEEKDERGNITQESFQGAGAAMYLFDVEYMEDEN
ncbi:hypothetical protein [Mesobacillus subterraneus]|uniref:Uncharacterized protein n=1 Tax=Mesobacillus subterraneus TaxID=285983 RepID=A0A3R9F172_9BACI|nr:hypothetical protein [Mesobacillus subterraneus]RSD26859.1 hypothetical protein EJA10_13495 [Mesobacillus subterraneus]